MSQRNRVLSRAAILTIVCAICVPAGCTDTVTEVVAAASVAIQPSTGSVDVGSTLDLQATVRDGSGHVLTGRSVGWSSSAPSVASVDDAGTVRGVAPGAATITATAAGVSGTANVTVVGSSLAITPDSLGFTATVGGPDPASRTVSVSATGSAPLSAITLTIDYGAGQPSGWLNASVSSTTTPLVLTLHASPAGLTEGSYDAVVRIAAPGAGDTARVSASLAVQQPPPAAPSDLTTHAVSATRIELSWTDNASDESRFQVERSENGGGWAVLQDSLPANTTTYADTGLAAGVQFRYRVRACAGTRCSAYSAEATASTVTAPAAPSGLAIIDTSASTVSLAWLDNSDTETLFRLERSAAGGPWATVADSVPADATRYDDNSVAALTTYTYRVQACNDVGCSAWSAEASVTTPAAPLVAPDAPTDLVASSTEFDRVDLAWIDASHNESRFELVRRTGPSGGFILLQDSLPSGSTAYADTGLTATTEYTYAVRACNAAGCSQYTDQATVTTAARAILSLSATSVADTAVQGGSNPPDWAVTVSNGGGSTLDGLATSVEYGPGASGWLAAVLDTTAAPAKLTLAATLGSLTEGTYTATVHVSSPAATNSPQDATFTLVVSPPAPAIALSPAVVTFDDAVEGGPSPAAQVVDITNAGGGTLDNLSTGAVVYDEAGGWLVVTLAPGPAPTTITLTPTTDSLPAGTYHAHMPVVSSTPDVQNSPDTLDVSLTVTPGPVISIDSATVGFAATLGGADPAPKTVIVSNAGGSTLDNLSVGTIAYGVGEPVGWLAAALDRDSADAALTLTATDTLSAADTLPAGTYHATVPVQSAAIGVTNSPQSVSVTFTVSPPPPSISLASSSATFSGVAGTTSPGADSIAIGNGGGGTLAGLAVDSTVYDAGQTTGWLGASIGPAAPTFLTLTPATDTLSAGTYHATVWVASSQSNVANSPQPVDVTLTLDPGPAISLDSLAVSFADTIGSVTQQSTSLSVTNAGGGTLDGLAVGTISYSPGGAGWLEATVGTSLPTSVDLTVHPNALSAGTYTATVDLTSTGPGVTNSPVEITVTFAIAAPPPP